MKANGRSVTVVWGVVTVTALVVAGAAITLQMREKNLRLAKEQELSLVKAEKETLEQQMREVRQAKLQIEADLGRSYCVLGDGTALVGARIDSVIYRAGLGTYHDAGQPLRRLRRPPRITDDDDRRLFHQHLHLVTDAGEGPATAILRWSDDRGKTFSSDHLATTGKVGEYQTRVDWGPLGASRGRGYEWLTTDNAPVVWRDAYLDVLRGTS